MAPNLIADELIDDSINDTPVAGLKGESSLKDRFTYRLSCMLKTNVVVPKTDGMRDITIYITPISSPHREDVASKEQTTIFAKDLQRILRSIADTEDGMCVFLLYICY